MNEPLASSPACPPFPTYTALELRALQDIAKLFGEDEVAFCKQVAASQVIDRINTGAGFYTRIVVDPKLAPPARFDRQGTHYAVEGVEGGVGVLVWDAGGYLSCIEGWTVVNSQLDGRDLAGLVVTSRWDE